MGRYVAMESVKKLSLLLFIFFLTGFTSSFQEEKIETAFKLNSSSTFKGYFYLGSNDKFHFFTEKWDYSKDRNFKINKLEMPINFEKPVNSVNMPISLTHKTLDIFSIYKYGNNKIVLYVVNAT